MVFGVDFEEFEGGARLEAAELRGARVGVAGLAGFPPRAAGGGCCVGAFEEVGGEGEGGEREDLLDGRAVDEWITFCRTCAGSRQSCDCP